jgi:fibronectin-binding autotransporter adhesin
MAIECGDGSHAWCYPIFRWLRFALALLIAEQTADVSSRAAAQTYTWTSPINGNWSAAANWDILPVGSDATTLQFNAAGSQAYTATNDLADPFFLNQIVLNSTSSGRSTITGAKLRFLGGGAKIRQDGTGAFQIDAPLKFDVPLSLEGSGSGFVTFTGALSGMGGIIKGGSSTYVFGTAGSNAPAMSTFAGGLTIDDGTIRFADAQYSGPTAFRSNRVRFTAGAGSLIFDNSDANLGIELRIGELAGAAGSLLQARTSGNSSERGLDVLITTLGDAEYSGTFTNTAVSLTSDGILRIRGIANQTISGPFNINSDIEVYSGATLTLSNSASIGSATGGRIFLNGGKLVFDARAMTGSNLIRNGSATAGGIDGGGGGTFRFIGKTTGSSESLGRLELTDSSVNRAGAMHIELVHTATSAATVLTFASLDRQLPNAPRSTIDFAAFDADGNTLNLGQTGSNPRIVFSSGIFLSNSLLSRTTSAAASMSGYATVNGTDFATHNATNGISAVATTAWTGSASSTTNFRLTADGTTGGAGSTFGVNSLKMDSSGGPLTLDISGTGNFQTNGIILAGSNAAAITSSGGGAWIGVGVRYAHVRQAVLTIGASIADTNPLVKAGGGTLILTNTANSASNAVLAINEGVVRGSSTTLPAGAIELRGGVLEITGGGTFNRTIGTGANNLNWSGATQFDRGSGGFAAFGAPIVVDLNQVGANEIWWGSANFILEGYSLIFGSTTADARITLLDSLGLSEQNAPAVQAYNAREIRIVDNPNSAADFARFSGVVSGDFTEDLLKTGAGILELSNANTYLGGTIVADGTLLLANDLALGDPTAAYVLLGARSGTADVMLATSLTSGSMIIARDILVQSGSSGTATIGNAIAPDAATTANALFSGDILVGLQGDTLAKGLKFNAVAGTTVMFSGSLTTHAGYGGVVSVEKIGYCPRRPTQAT